MPQTLALYAKNPEINFPGMAAAGQDYRLGEQTFESNAIANSLARMRAGAEQGELGALAAYRAAAEKGDANALDTLRGYPEIQSRFHTALKSLKAEDQEAALRRGTEIAQAAQRVAALPPGSDARLNAWNAELDGLRKRGIISQQHYETYYNNPSDMVLDQALSLGQTVKEFTTARGKPAGVPGLTPEQLIKIDEQVNDYIQNYFGGSSALTYLDPDQLAAREQAANIFRQRLIREATEAATRGARPTQTAAVTPGAVRPPVAPPVPGQPITLPGGGPVPARGTGQRTVHGASTAGISGGGTEDDPFRGFSDDENSLRLFEQMVPLGGFYVVTDPDSGQEVLMQRTR